MIARELHLKAWGCLLNKSVRSSAAVAHTILCGSVCGDVQQEQNLTDWTPMAYFPESSETQVPTGESGKEWEEDGDQDWEREEGKKGGRERWSGWVGERSNGKKREREREREGATDQR